MMIRRLSPDMFIANSMAYPARLVGDLRTNDPWIKSSIHKCAAGICWFAVIEP